MWAVPLQRSVVFSCLSTPLLLRSHNGYFHFFQERRLFFEKKQIELDYDDDVLDRIVFLTTNFSGAAMASLYKELSAEVRARTMKYERRSRATIQGDQVYK